MTNCPQCGARQLKQDARFCHHCGAAIPEMPTAVSSRPDSMLTASAPGPRWFWPAFAALVTIAVVSGVLAVLLAQGKSPASDARAWITARGTELEEVVQGLESEPAASAVVARVENLGGLKADASETARVAPTSKAAAKPTSATFEPSTLALPSPSVITVMPVSLATTTTETPSPVTAFAQLDRSDRASVVRWLVDVIATGDTARVAEIMGKRQLRFDNYATEGNPSAPVYSASALSGLLDRALAAGTPVCIGADLHYGGAPNVILVVYRGIPFNWAEFGLWGEDVAGFQFHRYGEADAWDLDLITPLPGDLAGDLSSLAACPKAGVLQPLAGLTDASGTTAVRSDTAVATSSPTPTLQPTSTLVPSVTLTITPSSTRRRRVAYVSDATGAPQIWLVDADGANRRQLTSQGGNLGPAWSADNSYLYYISNRDGQAGIYRQELATGAEEPIVTGQAVVGPLEEAGGQLAYVRRGGAGYELVWGQRPIYSLDRRFDFHWSEARREFLIDPLSDPRVLYVVNPQDSAVREVAGAKSWNGSWVPDGRIVYTSDRLGTAFVFVADADGSNARTIVPTDKWSQSPSWSPDGRWIGYVAGDGPAWNLYRVASDGSGRSRVGQAINPNESPIWEPNGQRMAYETTRRGNRDIVVVDLQGREIMLAASGADDYSPAWSN